MQNTFRFVLVVALAGAGVVFVAYLRLTAGERQTHAFEDFQELQDSGLIEQGWVPTWVPRSATEITVRYDLDASRSWMQFRVPHKDPRELFSTVDSAAQLDNWLLIEASPIAHVFRRTCRDYITSHPDRAKVSFDVGTQTVKLERGADYGADLPSGAPVCPPRR